MAIIQLDPYDLLTAPPARLLLPTGFWASLARLSPTGTARLLMVADNLRPEDVLAGFAELALPMRELPPEARWLRLQYEQFLKQTVQETRYMRLFLLADTTLGEEGLLSLLGAY